jgi:hypothetical protein
MLTPKQENFCIAYLDTGSASEAYRQAYDAEKMKPETITRNSKAMLDKSKIATRLADLGAPVIEKAKMTLESHLETLAGLRDVATKAEQYSAAIRAEENRGNVAGLYTTKLDIFAGSRDIRELSDEELLRLTDGVS